MMSTIRLKGSNPSVEATASNLSFILGASGNDSLYDYASVTFKNSRAPARASSSSSGSNSERTSNPVTTTFLQVVQTMDGVAVCSESPLFPEVSPSNYSASISLRTRDIERARIDAHGFWASELRAGVYGDLVNDYATQDVNRPPSASALSSAFVTLSNMIQAFVGSNAVASPPRVGDVVLVDTFASTSLTEAPTANALNAAYTTLSNSLNARLVGISNGLPHAVYTASVSALALFQRGNSGNTGNAANGMFANDQWLVSIPDGEPRIRFDTRGETVFAAGGDFAGAGSFRWFVNDVQRTVATLDGEGNLATRGGAAFDAGLVAASVVAASVVSSNVVCDTLDLGGVRFNSDGVSNIGINLPANATPQYALHVQGLIYSDEGVYALSDSNEKSDIQPLLMSTERLRDLRGYAYTCRGRRRLGLLAQDVLRTAPEAVISTPVTAPDGTPLTPLMAVSYADILAIVVEAVKELTREVDHLRACIAS
jgi:hypothetical protein